MKNNFFVRKISGFHSLDKLYKSNQWEFVIYEDYYSLSRILNNAIYVNKLDYQDRLQALSAGMKILLIGGVNEVAYIYRYIQQLGFNVYVCNPKLLNIFQ